MLARRMQESLSLLRRISVPRVNAAMESHFVCVIGKTFSSQQEKSVCGAIQMCCTLEINDFQFFYHLQAIKLLTLYSILISEAQTFHPA